MLLRATLLPAGQYQVYTHPEGQQLSLLASVSHSLFPWSMVMVLSLHAFKRTVSKPYSSMAFPSSGQPIQLFVNDPGPHMAMRKIFFNGFMLEVLPLGMSTCLVHCD